MRKKLFLLPLIIFLLALAAPARAQNRAGAVSLSPFVGGYTFACFQHLDTDWYMGLRVGYNFTDHWGTEGFLGYIPTQSNTYKYDDLTVNAFRYGGELLYHFRPDKKFVPFIAVGAGGIQINDPSGLNDHERFMLDYGVGVKYFVTEDLALRADVRHDLFCEFDKLCSNLEYTVGLTFLFGGKAPAVVAFVPPPITPTGCATDPRNGATNVAVTKNVSTSFSGPMPKGNLVVTRSDQTRVKGTVAYNRTTKSTTFTPDAPFAPDTTYTATVTNGTQELNDSCVWSFTTAPVVLIELDDTHFAFDSSALTPRGKEVMDENIRTLKANPKLRFLIAGYASARGTDEYNQALSERRATTVNNYLINEGGIAPDRLEKIGYGETRPAYYEVEPKDIESRAAQGNRRVLFTIIEK